MSGLGFPGVFPGRLTTGNMNIGAVQFGRTGKGFPGVFPAGFTTGTINIGAVQLAAVAAGGFQAAWAMNSNQTFIGA